MDDLQKTLTPLLFILLITAGGNLQAQVECSDGDLLCYASAVTDGASTTTRSYQLDFSTSQQSLWSSGPADGTQGNTFSIDMINQDQFSIDPEISIGKLSEYCFDDNIGSLLSGVNLLDYGLSFVVDAFKDAFGNPCFSFGAELKGDIDASFGLSVALEGNGGEVTVKLPIAVSIDYPSAQTFEPGQAILINTTLALNGTANIGTSSPDFLLTPQFSSSASGQGSAKGCIDDCSTSTLWNFNEDTSRNFDVINEKLQLQKDDLSTDPLGYFMASTGHIGAPLITTSGTSTTEVNLSASGSDNFIDLQIDISTWLSRATDNTVNLLKNGSISLGDAGSANSGKQASIDFSLLNLDAFTSSTLSQQTSFTPTFFISFDLSTSVPYSIIEGAAIISMGVSNAVTLEAGQSLQLQLPPELTDNISISSRVFQSNIFTTSFTEHENSHGQAIGLSGTVSSPSARIFNERCVDLFFGTICTPNWDWQSFSLSGGPQINETNLAPINTSYPLYTPDSWELEGFQSYQLSPFVLEPALNTEPELHLPMNITVEGNTLGGASADHPDILHFIAEASANDAEDGILTVEHSQLPTVITLNQPIEITFSVTDSFGAVVSDTATITVVDTLPPMLSIDELIVVAEGPMGSEIPDQDEIISAWLDSLEVVDIVDPSINYEYALISPLLLGENQVTFTASDSSGNSTELVSSIYLNAPFSIFASHKLIIHDHASVISGTIVNVGQSDHSYEHYSSKHQTTAFIGKSVFISDNSPFYGDNIYIGARTTLPIAFYNHKHGWGRVDQPYAAVPDITSPFAEIPLASPGDNDVKVNCYRHCNIGSRSTLAPGVYGDLLIHKGHRRHHAILYLEGGSYTFNSIELGSNTELRALGPVEIQVLTTVKAADNVYIGPDQTESLTAADVFLFINGESRWQPWWQYSSKRDHGYGHYSHHSKRQIWRRNSHQHKTVAFYGGYNTTIGANIITPSGTIRIESWSHVIGSLIAREVNLGKHTMVEFGGGF